MSDPPRRYVTTPIYYASGEPHIGHAYTTILADALARFWRQEGSDVLFLTGTDEHGQKIQEEAARRNLEPIELCDQMAGRFKDAWVDLNIDYDRFIRTTEAEHIAVVQAFVQKLWDDGLIYEGQYSGWYSIHEERYFTEKEIGPDRTDPISNRPLERIEEKNYFFKMSAFQDQLLRQIEENPNWIMPETRKNEILGFLQRPLEDLSISRPKARLSWGIPLPFDPDHVCYVWVDALINYLTASGAVDSEGEFDPRETSAGSWWPADLHIVGKDIITTHAVYWPTLLMGVGAPLPRQILAHGWWIAGDAKMSKTTGNVVDPLELRAQFGTDAVRWYLLREMPTGGDASYTPERFLARYDELANVFGNLASRAIAMIVKYRDGVVPSTPGAGLAEPISETLDAVRGALSELRVHDALAAAMDLARTVNGYIETSEPWALAKDEASAEALDEVLATLARALTVLVALFFPVVPGKVSELATRLGLDGVPTLDEATQLILGGLKVERGDPLFPKAELLG